MFTTVGWISMQTLMVFVKFGDPQNFNLSITFIYLTVLTMSITASQSCYKAVDVCKNTKCYC